LQARDWSHIKSGAQFEKEYAKVYGGSLKGGEWGRARSRDMPNSVCRRADGAERPIWNDASAAVYCWNSNYDYEVSHFKIDPKTLARVPR